MNNYLHWVGLVVTVFGGLALTCKIVGECSIVFCNRTMDVHNLLVAADQLRREGKRLWSYGNNDSSTPILEIDEAYLPIEYYNWTLSGDQRERLKGLDRTFELRESLYAEHKQLSEILEEFKIGEPDKERIRKALLDGEEVPGAAIRGNTDGNREG